MSAEPIFMCGMYKCGTSWLLAALSRHPDVTGLREIDIVKSAAHMDKSVRNVVGGMLKGKGVLPLSRGQWPILRNPAPVATRMGSFFGRSAWSRLPVEWVNALEGGTATLPAASGVDGVQSYETINPEIAAALFSHLREDKPFVSIQDMEPEVEPKRHRPLSLTDLPATSTARLFEQIRNAKTVVAALDAFLDATTTLAGDDKYLLLKGADQVAVYNTLHDWKPDARKIAIVRDGRDASISAMHYRALMKSEKAPWLKNEAEFDSLLEAWNNRAKTLAQLAAEGYVYLVRYEDLTQAFAETLTKVLQWLDLDHDEKLVAGIEHATNFEKMTGRKRGEEAKHVMRKGQIREWLDALDDQTRQRAWSIAGDGLSALGYTEDGTLNALPASLTLEGAAT